MTKRIAVVWLHKWNRNIFTKACLVSIKKFYLFHPQTFWEINFRYLDYEKISLAMYLSFYVYTCMHTLLLYEMTPKTFFPLISSLVNFYYEGMHWSRENKYCRVKNVKYLFERRHLYRTFSISCQLCDTSMTRPMMMMMILVIL